MWNSKYNATAFVMVSLICDMPVRGTRGEQVYKRIGQRLKKLCQCQTAVPNAGILLKYLQSCPNKRVKKYE